MQPIAPVTKKCSLLIEGLASFISEHVLQILKDRYSSIRALAATGLGVPMSVAGDPSYLLTTLGDEGIVRGLLLRSLCGRNDAFF